MKSVITIYAVFIGYLLVIRSNKLCLLQYKKQADILVHIGLISDIQWIFSDTTFDVVFSSRRTKYQIHHCCMQVQHYER